MNANADTRQPSAGKKEVKVKLPTKTAINLANVGVKKTNKLVAVLAVVLVIIAVALLSKFLVIDRFASVTAAENANNELQRQIDEGYRRIASFGDLSDKYAHYTYTDMTAAELESVDRNQIMDLLRRLVLPDFYLGSWTVTGNKLTVTVVGSTLQELNLLSQSMMEEPIVDYGYVTTARTTDNRFVGKDLVDGTITLYLKRPAE